MSAAAVKAKKQAKAAESRARSNERFFAMAEHTSLVDSAVVTCDICGLLQVTHQGHECLMCGSLSLVSTSAPCGVSSCPGQEDDPDFPAAICTREFGHDGMHSNGRCSWLMEEAA